MNRFLQLPAATATVLTLTLTGCAAQKSDPDVIPPRIEHVHVIAPDPRGDGLLVATHGGIFTVAANGEVSGPIGGHEFDAMGFTIAADTLYASGHPGTETPAELGSPNLGIIRSDDYGATWSPVALNGSTDFHSLTAGPDGTLYGILSDGNGVLISTDDGKEWTPGATLSAADLMATEDGLFAATGEGLLFSADGGVTFAPVNSAPILYALDAKPDGTLAGIGTDGALWSQNADGTWRYVESLQGTAQAFSATGVERFVLVDGRGIVEITPDGTTVVTEVQ